MDKMHQTPDVPGTEPVTDNPNPGGTQGMDSTGPETGGWKPKPGEGSIGSDMKTFRCADAGNEGCLWETAGRTEDELRPQIERHGREAHGINDIGSLWSRFKDAIRERAA